MNFPEKLDLLHEGEEFIRAKSKETIEASDDLSHHLAMVVESMDLIDHFARHYRHTSDDQLVVQLLGIRVFNGTAAAIQNMSAGYYQDSVKQQRDLLEVSFLLDYFSANKATITEWKVSTEGERNKRFGAVVVRKALDDRDGFTERKREAHYKLLCNLGAHASYQGFQMLQPVAGGDAHCGPYFAATALGPTLSELAKVVLGSATNFTVFFSPKDLADCEVKLRFMESQALWFERFMGQPVDHKRIEEMRAIVVRAKAA
jgi:hypothetical protein